MTEKNKCYLMVASYHEEGEQHTVVRGYKSEQLAKADTCRCKDLYFDETFYSEKGKIEAVCDALSLINKAHGDLELVVAYVWDDKPSEDTLLKGIKAEVLYWAMEQGNKLTEEQASEVAYNIVYGYDRLWEDMHLAIEGEIRKLEANE